MKSVPLIETAIMGGKVEKGLLDRQPPNRFDPFIIRPAADMDPRLPLAGISLHHLGPVHPQDVFTGPKTRNPENLFGSAMIFIDRPFQIGDTVDINGLIVQNLRAFSKQSVSAWNAGTEETVVD